MLVDGRPEAHRKSTFHVAKYAVRRLKVAGVGLRQLRKGVLVRCLA